MEFGVAEMRSQMTVIMILMLIDITQQITYPVENYLYRGTTSGLSSNVVV